MGVREEILEKLARSVAELDPDLATEASQEALQAGVDPIEAMNGCGRGMDTISALFDEGELFVPEILIAAEAFANAVKVLEQAIPQENRGKSRRGKVIVHTVQGDIHDVGKNIVKTMLAASGFEVFDLGRDVPVDTVIEKAKELKVDIISGSALMTTTMPSQRDIVKGLVEEGIRDQVKCMFGGAPVSQEWVDRIGADGYADNAADAVKVAKELVSH